MLPRTALLASALALIAAPSTFAFPHCVNFDTPATPGIWGCCGSVFTYGGVDFTTEAYDWGTSWYTGGEARVDDFDGDGDQELWPGNVNVNVDVLDLLPPYGPRRVRIVYEDYGGTVNLRVNGMHVLVSDFDDIAPATFHSVGAHYAHTTLSSGLGYIKGTIVLRGLDGGCIEDLSIGGQELILDPICGANPCTTAGDVDGDLAVDFDDLVRVISRFGEQDLLDEDLDGDGVVALADLLEVLANFGG